MVIDAMICQMERPDAMIWGISDIFHPTDVEPNGFLGY
jgi:hypothetical protein